MNESNSMQEIDVFARIIKDYGAPRHLQQVSKELSKHFEHRIPQEFINFWLTHGWGDYKEGYFHICDPRYFDDLLKYIFKKDLEFDPKNLTVLGYTAFNTLRVWDRTGRTILIHLEDAEVFAPPFSSLINPDTGKSYSQAFLSGLLIYDELSLDVQDYYREACAKIGTPDADEVFGYAPALQLGGEWGLDHVRRFKALEHMTFLAQLSPLTLTELTDPQPDAPMGHMRNVRRIGPQ